MSDYVIWVGIAMGMLMMAAGAACEEVSHKRGRKWLRHRDKFWWMAIGAWITAIAPYGWGFVYEKYHNGWGSSEASQVDDGENSADRRSAVRGRDSGAGSGTGDSGSDMGWMDDRYLRRELYCRGVVLASVRGVNMDVITASRKGRLYTVAVKRKNGPFCQTEVHEVLAETYYMAAKAATDGYDAESIVSSAVFERMEDYESSQKPAYESIGPRASPVAFGRGGSIYRGVSANKKPGRPWIAKISVDGVTHHLGTHQTEEDAARAYDEASRKFLGDAARPNFPMGISAV